MVVLNKELNTPLVSVLMPAYNSEAYIEQAIRSVMEQTVTDWELLVIDDKSKDATCRIVEELAREDNRIHLYENEENCGAARTRNRGLDLCRGRYVALLDSDDIWYADKLALQLALAEKEQADIVYCSYALIGENGEKQCNDFIVPETTSFEETLSKSVISCSTALLGRSVVDSFRFPLGYYHEDLAMWLQLLQNGMKAVGTPEVLAAYRLRQQSRASNKLLVAKRRWLIYRDYLGLPFWKSALSFVKYAVNGVKKYFTPEQNVEEIK